MRARHNFIKKIFLSLSCLQSCGIIHEKSRKLGDSPAPGDRSYESRSAEPGRAPRPSALRAKIVNHPSDVGVDIQLSIDAAALDEKSAYLVRISRKEEVHFIRYLSWRDRDFRRDIIDYDLRSGERYTYALVEDPRDFVVDPQLSVDVLAPLNLEVLPGQTLLLSKIAEQYPDCFSQKGSVKNLKFGRLILRDRSQLLSEGSDWWIQARYFGSQNGTLASFEKDRSAVRGMPGRSSGKIFLEIDSGQGHLFFVSRGENGGAGFDGFDGRPGQSGKAGRAAQSIYYVSEFSSQRDRYLCRKRATWGPVGTIGQNGSDGGRGQRGGDSESFSFRVSGEEASDLQVEFESVAGLGGLGGRGGQGGSGGGRVLGRRAPPCKTPAKPLPGNASNGKEGAAGVSGKLGVGDAKLCLANERGLFRQGCFDPSFRERSAEGYP